ncbi:Superfamily I DNA or RNA helicase [Mesorhizobium albiziae]|uniref:DNA 3'-5' helicase n=1 Tax=Neomesorhizobium albiziae TaxID=335020 RepID=A0A1I4FCS6_9HYPH|nr:ATP-dependent helicase [Mesorhizobium albiziae]GLS33067.1 DNA helicase [Mesorhizobium albiziae]SFL14616.1 Superfamily I DNA or RNA helicase [Mesorhizobium albiziae]
MDSFLAVRIAANSLRATAEISDKTDAPTAVRAAALKRGLSIRPLDYDDPELEGAIGLLERKYRQILVRKQLKGDFEAEVIAHEIGHHVLHDGPEAGFYQRHEQNGGDPTQRIETYGIKERREAQANAFAREFVLPRALARRLFAEGLRASDISRSLQVPYETVLQQLADGILLPELPPVIGLAPPAVPEPNDSQRRAADHRGAPFLLSAGPGTGKTKTLVDRIAGLLREGVPASAILALTFSNKAAQELADRLHILAGPTAVNLWSGTFHSFGLDTIRKHHALFGVSEDPRVVDTSEAIALMEDALPALDLRHYLNLFEPALALRDIFGAISRAKDELCSLERYAKLAAEMRANATSDDEVVAAEKAAEVAVVYRYYEEQLRALRAVDYGDLIVLPTLKMREDADFGELMRCRFAHVLVDEYQDINRAGAMLVRELVGRGERLWVVGDARQSLYRFRGASAVNIDRFKRDYPIGQRDSLTINYRSTPEIVSTYTAFGREMRVADYAGSAELTPASPKRGVAPAIYELDDAEAEMEALAGNIRALEREGIELKAQTVLARSNGTLARVAEALEARDVPVLYLGPLFDRPEVRDLLALLSLLVDASGSGLVRVGAFPEYAVPLADSRRLIEHARVTEVRVFDLLQRVEEMATLSPVGRAGLRQLALHLDEAHQGTTPWLFVSRFLFEHSDYVRTVLSGQSPSDDMRRVAVRQLIDALRAMPLTGRGTPVRRALDRIRHMILLADERDLRQLPPELADLNGVRLMTIHASKGLEFDAVHLPCLYAGAIPAANRPPACPPPAGMVDRIEGEDAHEAEEECILYVGMSRARSRLLLYRPTKRGGRNANPSRFLARVPVAVFPASGRIARKTPPPTYPLREVSLSVSLSAADIERYAGCPRRFFYQQVLGLGGYSRTGAFLQAHGCVQAAIRYVRDLEDAGDYDRSHANGLFDQAWKASGLDAHPFAAGYRKLVDSMLDRLHAAADGVSARSAKFVTTIGAEPISVTADRVVAGSASPVVRNLRSGRGSANDTDRLSATLQLKAVAETLGAGARIETHYLASGAIREVAQSDAKYRKRIADCEEAVASIRAGEFPPAPSDFNCPRCAFLFICPAPTTD